MIRKVGRRGRAAPPGVEHARCARSGAARELLHDWQAAAGDAAEARGAGAVHARRAGDAFGANRLAVAAVRGGRRRIGRRAGVVAAVGRDGGLADAELAAAAGVHALGHLRAGRALRRIGEVLVRARRGETDGRRRARDKAAAEAVTAVRDVLAAVVDALLRLRGRGRAQVRVLGDVARVVGARAGLDERVALELPLAAVVAHARVAVEEAVLFASVHVVTWDAGPERALVVVGGARAFGIGRVDEAVAVVVDPVRTLRRPELSDDGAARASGPGGARGAGGSSILRERAHGVAAAGAGEGAGEQRGTDEEAEIPGAAGR